ncbi:MAG: crossover junction endodeoxyribonuclease RuvC, partial [Planctomycetes bacterium]|nr:crossover junction endodeoxyribonuclease RuvC [Planctomycetota bacterium]
GASFPERLRQIFDGLTQVVRKHRPDCVAVEEIFYGKSVKSAIRTGEGRGVALLCAALAKLPVSEYAATVVKKAVVGVGSAHKQQVQEMVRVLLGLRGIPEPEDAADALAIAICHCHRRRDESQFGLRLPKGRRRGKRQSWAQRLEELGVRVAPVRPVRQVGLVRPIRPTGRPLRVPRGGCSAATKRAGP